VEGTLPYADFMKRIGKLRKEYTHLANSLTNGMVDVVLNEYPATEEHVNALAYSLSRKLRYDDAIALLKLNVEMHPSSAAAHDSLAKAYFTTGNRQMAAVVQLPLGSAEQEGELSSERERNSGLCGMRNQTILKISGPFQSLTPVISRIEGFNFSFTRLWPASTM
jgi:hypothetical protein